MGSPSCYTLGSRCPLPNEAEARSAAGATRRKYAVTRRRRSKTEVLAARTARERSQYEAQCAQLGLDAGAFENAAMQDWSAGKVTKPEGVDYWEWLTSLLPTEIKRPTEPQCPMIACTERPLGTGDHPELCVHHGSLKMA